MIHMILNDCELDRERSQRLITSRIRKPNYSDSWVIRVFEFRGISLSDLSCDIRSADSLFVEAYKLSTAMSGRSRKII